jgi:hypothetical protein
MFEKTLWLGNGAEEVVYGVVLGPTVMGTKVTIIELEN